MRMAQGRLKLLALAAVFVAPLAAAVLLYFVPEWRPAGRVNHGTLIEPVRVVPALALADARGGPAPDALRGKWSLVYLAGEDCGDSCRERLALERQVRLALGRDRHRLQRLYLAPTEAALGRAREALEPEHPDLVFIVDRGAPGARAADFFGARDADALYLLDPVGNWVMVYTGQVRHKGLHRDLKKLLRMSSVG
jgi:hypothetical protein